MMMIIKYFLLNILKYYFINLFKLNKMTGALMQLVAYGAQDVYLTGGNGGHFEKFRIYYKKHIIGDIVIKFEIIGWEFIENFKIKNDAQDIKNMFKNILTSIDCSTLNIKKLPKFNDLNDFDKLKDFNCSHNKLRDIEKLKYINLIKLDCSYNSIYKIPYKMKLLEYFDFSNNNIMGKIDLTYYSKLKYLLASSNKINEISNYPEELVYLDLSNNPIECIDNLPNSLEYLLIVQTGIKKINLTKLTNLKYLDISINNFENIDGLPNGLVYLNCSQCSINNLDNLPTSLEKLICINNKLISLNMLPESIKYLDCDHNEITMLDDLPNGLEELICSHNKLTTLNNLPPKLKSIDCSNNLLHTFTNKPKTLKIIIDKNNDNLNIKIIDKNNDNLLKSEKKKLNKERKYMELSMRRFNKH